MDAYGYDALGSKEWLEGDRLYRLGFQYAAVETLVREYFIGEEPFKGKKAYETEWKGKPKSIVYGRGDVSADAVIVRRPSPTEKTIPWRALLDYLPQPPLPLFVIDLSMKFLHTPEELSKLRLQLSVTLSVMREYLWDAHMSVTGTDEETAKWINEVMGVNKVAIVNARPSEVLWGYDADKVIILRPDASTPLKADDVMTADAFLLGGIVDKIPRPGLSRMLDSLVPWGVPRRIELRGSVIGVPERINRIVEILLKSRYLYDGDVEKAIITTMSKKDRVARAYREIMKYASERKVDRVGGDFYEQLRSWLSLTYDEFLEAARRAHVEVAN
ncbi:MAG: tRNA (guanine-N1)-methyltransferase [Acidilobus sp.]|jgi:tRNA (adenine9-N1/guanine9-N1)-methyltransferase